MLKPYLACAWNFKEAEDWLAKCILPCITCMRSHCQGMDINNMHMMSCLSAAAWPCEGFMLEHCAALGGLGAPQDSDPVSNAG